MPAPALCDALARDLDLLALRKLRFVGKVSPDGARDWRVEARLGVTVEQPCVVTLEPVTTRIEETLIWRFLSDVPKIEPNEDEVEMPEDESIESLGDEIALMELMKDALVLTVPVYPRKASDVKEPARIQVAPPGQALLTDDDVKPFAGLADFRRKLEGDRS